MRVEDKFNKVTKTGIVIFYQDNQKVCWYAYNDKGISTIMGIPNLPKEIIDEVKLHQQTKIKEGTQLGLKASLGFEGYYIQDGVKVPLKFKED